jgi:quercetin dioxygenase-like cupin family protein
MSERSISAATVEDRPQVASKPNTKKEINAAEPGKLIDLNAYQEASIVSRVLVGRDTGNVTLFAFDEGQELREHTAPFDELVQVLEGDTEIVISGQPFRLGAGEIILMPANRPHAVRAVSRFKMLLTMIRS